MVIFQPAILVYQRVHKNWFKCWTTCFLQNIQIDNYRPENERLVHLRMIFFWNSCSGFMLVFRGSTCIYSAFIYQFYHPLTSPQTFIQRTFQLPTKLKVFFYMFLAGNILNVSQRKKQRKKNIYTFLNIHEIFAFSLRVIEGLETSPD